MAQESNVILTDNYPAVTFADGYKDVVLTDNYEAESLTFDLVTDNKGIGFMKIEFDNIVA